MKWCVNWISRMDYPQNDWIKSDWIKSDWIKSDWMKSDWMKSDWMESDCIKSDWMKSNWMKSTNEWVRDLPLFVLLWEREDDRVRVRVGILRCGSCSPRSMPMSTPSTRDRSVAPWVNNCHYSYLW